MGEDSGLESEYQPQMKTDEIRNGVLSGIAWVLRDNLRILTADACR
jgi:hypothetical protein